MKNKKIKKILLSILLVILVCILTFIVYEVTTVDNTYYIGEKNLQIPILVYHDIVPNESDVKYDYMQTTLERFEQQITGLMNLGYKPITYEDLKQYSNGKKSIPKWSFIITFDDGFSGVYKYAFELAKKYNIPMTSFIINDCIGTSGYFSWEEAKEMYDSGLISVYSHGLTHIEYNKVSTEELVSKTNKSYEIIEEQLENPNLLKVFTYPYGLYTNEQRNVLANEGYIQNLTDNRINLSNKLDLSGLHRTYALDNSAFKIFLKTQYRVLRYK